MGGVRRLPKPHRRCIRLRFGGHVHANNLKDSGVNVIVGLRTGSGSAKKAEAAGLEMRDIPEAVKTTDLIMMLASDEHQAKLYRNHVHKNMEERATLIFAHGFNIHYEQIEPRCNVNVLMIARKWPGHLVRSTYEKGRGVSAVIAVVQDSFGRQPRATSEPAQ